MSGVITKDGLKEQCEWVIILQFADLKIYILEKHNYINVNVTKFIVIKYNLRILRNFISN